MSSGRWHDFSISQLPYRVIVGSQGLSYGVMVALQVLVLSVQVRILVRQHNPPPVAARIRATAGFCLSILSSGKEFHCESLLLHHYITLKHLDNMKIKTLLSAVAILGIVATGCVSNKKYAELQSQYGSTREELINCNADSRNLQAQLDAARQSNAELKKGMQELKNTLDKSMEANSQGSMNISKLVDEINASNKYIKQLVDAKSKSDSLNIALTNKLTRSLDTDELRDVDVKVLKGVVYISLADNMLFQTGSYEVSQRAMETLSKIAKILKDFKDYDVLVEGNTDNVPISRTNIRNNWDLSALRASSVVQVLQNDFGISPNRLSAAGRGEFNPIADNTSELGKQRNRRTEIIITPKLDDFLDLIDKAPETGEQAD